MSILVLALVRKGKPRELMKMRTDTLSQQEGRTRTSRIAFPKRPMLL